MFQICVPVAQLDRDGPAEGGDIQTNERDEDIRSESEAKEFDSGATTPKTELNEV